MMPIDLAALAHALPFRRAIDRLLGSFTPLGPWLTQRLEQLQILEPRTRGFPVYAFEGTALVGRVAATQAGALTAHGSGRGAIGGAIAAPFAAFGRGVGRVGQAASDETILPTLLGTIRTILVAIDEQIATYATPTATMFDPRTARAGHLFGLAAMAYRAIVTSSGQLRTIAGDIAWVRGLRDVGPSTPAAATVRAADPAATIPGYLNAQPLDTLTRYVVAALVVIPALPDILATLVRGIWTGFRLVVLTAIQSVEAQLATLRRHVYAIFFTTLPHKLRRIPAIVTVMGLLLADNVRHYGDFAQRYFGLLTEVLHDFLEAIRAYINQYIAIVDTVLSAIDHALDFDLLGIIRPFLGPSTFVLDYFGIRLTPNDLIDAAGAALNFALYHTLQGMIAAARVAVFPIPGARGRAASRALRLISEIVAALFANTGSYPDETIAPRLPRMPNLHQQVIGARGAAIGRSVASFGTAIARDIAGIIGVGARALTDLAATLSASADEVARTGPALTDFTAATATAANDLFADQVEALDARPHAPAGAIERWLSAGGFAAIGNVIPIYVGAMRSFWHDETIAGRGDTVVVTATSPHILARHAVLARVDMHRLDIRRGDRAIDEALVRETAQCVRRAVQDAYGEGCRILAQAASG
ncbi:hypothetical protein ASF00_01045 [Sphingomonas sp. Leaf34]|uniref:hypothetical protein n=1 Tax=Sphingomonas sp. Leaf34 TaxID=1736216 RepID=UPI0006F395B3|nr:hypothetical protein [Sphingomonas sp. Leaf34]KQN31424.1 hypothetical protein ASF00_01045 [Sphingomonas sp. Leaf34]